MGHFINASVLQNESSLMINIQWIKFEWKSIGTSISEELPYYYCLQCSSSFVGGAIHVEGFPARQLEFENFERKFEVKWCTQSITFSLNLFPEEVVIAEGSWSWMNVLMFVIVGMYFQVGHPDQVWISCSQRVENHQHGEGPYGADCWACLSAKVSQSRAISKPFCCPKCEILSLQIHNYWIFFLFQNETGEG